MEVKDCILKIVNAIIKNLDGQSYSFIVISKDDYDDILNCLNKIGFKGYGAIQSFIKEYRDIFSNFSIRLTDDDCEVVYNSRLVQYTDDKEYLYSL